MGRRGPRPEPTALRVLKGNPGKRPLPQREPKPGPGEHPAPRFLDAYGRAEWQRLAPLAQRIGLLTEVDDAAFAAYCEAYAGWRQARLLLRRIRADKSSKPLDVHRAEQSVRQWLALMRQYLAEFGLTPAARTRVETDESQQRPQQLSARTGTDDARNPARFFGDT